MKPSLIPNVLDLAAAARKNGHIFNPLFVSHAGLGKSQIIQSWVAEQQKKDPEFGFIDLRIAYLEAPDVVGLLDVTVDSNGTKRSEHMLPGFWPTSGSGLLLLEEPNRASSSVMNTLMQLLTDRKVHKYQLPPGWMIAGAINPETSEYDVNSMDAALKDRFEIFQVEFDHLAFSEYIEKSNWHEPLVRFVNSGMWVYKTPDTVSAESQYVSPRTWSKVNTAEKAGVGQDRLLHRLMSTAVLGKDIGNAYHTFCFDQAPVTADDLLRNRKEAIARLKEQSAKDKYQGDMIAATVESITKHYGGTADKCPADKVNEDLMAEVAQIIPSDQAVTLIKGCSYAVAKQYGSLKDLLKEFIKRHPALLATIKDNIHISKPTGGK